MCCRDRSTPKVDIGSSINRRNGLDPTPYPRSSGDNFAESAHMRPQPDAEALACPERSPRLTCCHPILGRPIVGRMKAPYGASLRHRDGASPFRHPNHSRKRPSQPISQCTGPAILRSQPPTFPPRPTPKRAEIRNETAGKSVLRGTGTSDREGEIPIGSDFSGPLTFDNNSRNEEQAAIMI